MTELVFLNKAKYMKNDYVKVNRIGAMVVDIRPPAGTAVSLEDIFGAYSVRDRHSVFLVSSRFESDGRTKFDIFTDRFFRKPKAHVLLFWLGQ